MILLYDTDKIYHALYDRDLFSFPESMASYSTLEIDEAGDNNRLVCADLLQNLHRADASGLQKYYVEGGELFVRDVWMAFDQVIYWSMHGLGA
jgi:hypothetical protein